MALKKVKKPEETQNTNNINDGFNTLFAGSQNASNSYNSPISYLNKNDDEITNDNEADKEIEEAQQYENNEYPVYESKDDAIPVKRTSKTDDELKKFLKLKMDKRKILNIDDYPGSVADVSIEEVKYPESEKYLRVRFALDIINDVPRENVRIDLLARLNLNYNSKLSRIIRSIIGNDVGSEFDLTSLVGKKVSVRTKFLTDKYGNIINHAIDTIQKID